MFCFRECNNAQLFHKHMIILWQDADILWFRNPTEYISPTSHLTLVSEYYHGDAENLSNVTNGGFAYARSCNETIKFYQSWHQVRKQLTEQHDQEVFNNVKLELASRYHVNIRFIDTAYCGGFCEFNTDFEKMCTIHANCTLCRFREQDGRLEKHFG